MGRLARRRIRFVSADDNTDSMDDADRAWLLSMVPEGCVPQGFIGVAAWFNDAGEMRWKVYNQLDLPISGVLGLLELAKLEMVNRCEPPPISAPVWPDE